ncbi:hypothetical protein NKG94_01620 [Micromonospora sp. M12]
MSELAGTPVPGLAQLWTHDPVTAGPYRLIGRLGAGGQGSSISVRTTPVTGWRSRWSTSI